MGDNWGILAKRLESRMKLSHGPRKPRFWSQDPTDSGLTGPHCIYLATFPGSEISSSVGEPNVVLLKREVLSGHRDGQILVA